MGKRKSSVPGLTFSWKRATGVTAAKRKIAKATGIPTTKAGRRNKARRLLIPTISSSKRSRSSGSRSRSSGGSGWRTLGIVILWLMFWPIGLCIWIFKKWAERRDAARMEVMVERFAQSVPVSETPIESDAGGEFPFPSEPDQFRGWTNIGRYEIRGINPKTNRSNKRTYDCLTSSEAVEKAEKEGLVGPFQITEVKLDGPTEAQLRYCEDIGIKEDFAVLSRVDVSALLSAKEDGDSRRINQREWDRACRNHVVISALAGPTRYHQSMGDDYGVG